MRKILFVLIALLLIPATLEAAKISLGTTNTDTIALRMEQNDSVASFHCSVTGLPIKKIVCNDPNKLVDFNGTKIIVYAMNNTVITNGDILAITFTLPQPYGSYPIVVTPLSGATSAALAETISKGADGLVSITFSASDVAMEKDFILDRSSVGGVDVNNDGSIDTADLQMMINNRR